MNLRVLAVDDSILFRRIVGEALSALPDIEVIGSASNGRLAMTKIVELKPDLITLDVEMPEMNGLEVLEAIKKQGIDVGIIMVSSLTIKGSSLTIKALELGAFDFITKPAIGTMEENSKRIREELAPRVKAYARRREVRAILQGKIVPGATESIAVEPKRETSTEISRRMHMLTQAARPEIVAIGVSTGGPNALAEVLTKLPADLGVPVVIVLHMPPLFTQTLAESLNSKCANIQVKEAEHGETALPGTAYLAPGGKHMKIMPGRGSDKVIHITDDPPENHCKPSVDYLFRSLANNWPGKVLSVIMTGMGNDGVLGLRLLKRHGGMVIAQDEASSVVFGMPKEAIAAGVVDIVTPLSNIAAEISRAFNRHCVS